MGPEAQAALALVEAGLPAAQVDRVMRMVGIEQGDTSEAVSAKVEALTADVPALFTPAGPGARPRPRLAAVGGQDPKDREQERFDQLGRDALLSAGYRPDQIRNHPSGSGPGGDAA